ncbi:right-handed parallel beta-helix repeat-containing protein [Agrilutibacter solisilvae]|uniref:Right-handed parallel beta-helix repeat-containing protein n=1 Tax=Agrilutibacter solisilvae TaxID=2763317 RepID=A0A974Y5Z5_9GAMM|nr:right-handed parallel beta-helix repeat-containing protein [Lysobacter solisilvae]QSX79171.1 right-handed parallel beta-helix repeat-containing protein [Lysobacter solisilvae]
MIIGRSLAALALAGLAYAGQASAAESYENCTGFIDSLPATVSTTGTWCLRADLHTTLSSGAAITVTSDNVTVDCNDFRLSGLEVGVGSYATGIAASQQARHNITVRNCRVEGFRYGIALIGFSHNIEDNIVEANNYVGIATRGEGNVVQNNLVRDTGGQPGMIAAYGIAMFGFYGSALNNTVIGVHGDDETDNAYGIAIERGSVQGNRVMNLAAIATGIRSYDYSVIRDNVVIHGTGSGVAIDGGNGRCRDNDIFGYEERFTNCAGPENEL